MTFGAPTLSLLFLLLPAAVGLLWYGAGARQRRLQAWAQAETAPRLAVGVDPRRRRLRAGLWLLGLAACVLALVRPQWGYHYEEVQRRGIDLVLVVDVSESMLAADVSPSRLERAKREIADFLSLVQGDRVALVTTAGTSFIQCPLTLDYAALREFLKLVDTDLIPTPGTDLGAALAMAARAVESSGASRDKAVVVISDGGNLEGDPAAMAASLHDDHGITIYAVGIGNPDEAVPIRTADGSLKEYEGKVVTTRLEEGTLQEIARAGGGVYVRAVTGDLDLEKIYTDIRERHTADELGTAEHKVFHERFVWPLGFGLLCLALEACVPERRRRAAVALLVGTWCLVSPARVHADDVARGLAAYEREDYAAAVDALTAAREAAPDDARVAFDLGTAHYQAGDPEAAVPLFEAAITSAEDAALRAQSLYNAGNAYAQLGQFDRAVDAYERALRIDPSDMDAKANLELVRHLIEEREQEQEQREQEQQEHEEQQSDEEHKGDQPQDKSGDQQQQSPSGNQPEDQADRSPEQQPSEAQSPDEAQQPSESPANPSAEDGAQNAAQQPSPASAGEGEEAEPGEEEAVSVSAKDGDTMSRAEAEQWLQQLPTENAEAIKDFWRRQQPQPSGPPRRDW